MGEINHMFSVNTFFKKHLPVESIISQTVFPGAIGIKTIGERFHFLFVGLRLHSQCLSPHGASRCGLAACHVVSGTCGRGDRGDRADLVVTGLAACSPGPAHAQ